MFGTMGEGITLIKNKTLIYSDELPLEENKVQDIVYIEFQDSYIFYANKNLYRKGNDGKPPSRYMRHFTYYKIGSCLQYSKYHKALIVNRNVGRTLSVINLKTNQVDFLVDMKVKRSSETMIRDFRVYGDHEDQVIALTFDGIWFSSSSTT